MLYVARPLYLSPGRYVQSSARLVGLIGLSGTAASSHAVGIDGVLDVNLAGGSGMRWSMGPYIGGQFMDRQMRSYVGLHQDFGFSVGIGSDPRSRILFLTSIYLPISYAQELFECDQINRDMTECGGIVGLTIAYEGMFL